MRRGGGDAGDNPRGKFGVQFNMPVPKFLQQIKDSTQTESQRKAKELEDRLNRDEDFDIQNAIVIREEDKKEQQKELEKVDMDTFKPVYVSKGDRNGLGALKQEIENKKKDELKKKQLQLKKLEEDKDKNKKESKDSKEKEKSESKSKESSLLNQKRRSIEEAMKNLEKETTIKKQVKPSLLSFNQDDEEED